MLNISTVLLPQMGHFTCQPMRYAMVIKHYVKTQMENQTVMHSENQAVGLVTVYTEL